MKGKNIWKRYLKVIPDSLEETKKELEELAKKGWILDHKEGARFVFCKIEGKKLNYSVEIFDRASDFDTFPNEQNMEYIEYCEKSGWHYICSSGKIQFFYSEDLNLTPIETDDRMKFDVICKSNRMQILLNGCLLPIIAALNFFLNLTFNRNAVELSFTSFSAFICWLVIMIIGLIYICRWFVWKRKCRKSVYLGTGVISFKHIKRKTDFILLSVIFGFWSIGGFFAWRMSGQLQDACIFIIVLMVLAIFPLINGILLIMQKVKAEPSMNVVLQIVIPIVFFFTLSGILSYFILTNENKEDAEVLLPLALTDIGAAYEHDIPYHLSYGDFLLSLDYYSESPIKDSEDLGINYYIYKTDIKAIYNRLLQDAKSGTFRTFGISFDFKSAISINGLKAEQTWYYKDDGYNYLFTYEGMIVRLHSIFEFNEEQLKTADAIFNTLAN